MMCPYLKRTKSVNGTTVEDFGYCYESECPWYRPEYIDGMEKTHPGECERVEAEYYKATHLGGAE